MSKYFKIYSLTDGEAKSEFFISNGTVYLLKDGTTSANIPSMLSLGYWETKELAKSFLTAWKEVNE